MIRPPDYIGINRPNKTVGRAPQVMSQMTIPRGSTGVPPIIATRLLTNGSAAPVCPVTRSEVPPAQPGIKVPPVPMANDLPSVINAINQIITIINEESKPHVKWLEKYRVTAIVRIFNPDDDSQWIDVERIMKLVMEDQDNGDLWVWELGPSEPTAPALDQNLINTGMGQQGGGMVRPSGF